MVVSEKPCLMISNGIAASAAAGVHILVIPFPACGHIRPLRDLTHQLLLRGVTKVTIMVTPKNLCHVNPLRSLHSSKVQTLVLPFPFHPSIPSGVENLQDVPVSFVHEFITALSELYDPLVQWFQTHPSPPIAILSDMMLASWTTKLGSQLNIPNFSFMVFSARAIVTWLNELETLHPLIIETFHGCLQSQGMIFNSFPELEGQKLDIIKAKYFTKHDHVWSVGPLLPLNAGDMDSEKSVMAWLDSCQVDNSVVYVGFGTQITLNKQQMEAVASALEKSGVRFVWVVKDPMKGMQNGDDRSVVPKGFEDRVAGRGIVIKGWAPQVAILRHRATGSYLSHCGWNSIHEAILAGVLLLAWPMQMDHFPNSKLLVDELGAAIPVCEGLETVPDADKLARILSDSVKSKTQQERVRAMKLRQTVLDAIKEAGSSSKALDGIVEKLSSFV
ncbi:hypothetical protein DITRI_Ditri15bG0033600 [Diplodiscus trichospermus]